MSGHEVTTLDPGVVDTNTTNQVYESLFSANIYVHPPVEIGPALGSFIAGQPGVIGINLVAGTSEGTHAIVSCARGRASHTGGKEAVMIAIERLYEYFNADPSRLADLRTQYINSPLLPGHNARQM